MNPTQEPAAWERHISQRCPCCNEPLLTTINADADSNTKFQFIAWCGHRGRACKSRAANNGIVGISRESACHALITYLEANPDWSEE